MGQLKKIRWREPMQICIKFKTYYVSRKTKKQEACNWGESMTKFAKILGLLVFLAVFFCNFLCQNMNKER